MLNIRKGKMIQIAAPIIEKEEIGAVNAVLESGMLAQGPKVAQLEEAFAKYCGTKHAVAVNSGTAALHAALHAAGVGPGDEVITTPFSFIATINPIIFQGAKPVLVDIDAATFNLDAKLVEHAITAKTKAIIAVDLYGQPADWDELRRIARKHQLILIEDACQAIGSEYGDEKAGALGDMGCFSLYATKNIMSGEGGVITTNSDDFASSMRSFRQHGMTAPYTYAGVGLNYRMTDLLAAIAFEQLKKVDNFNASRIHNAHKLSEGLEGVKGITLPTLSQNRSHVYHQYTILLNEDFPLTREQFAQSLRDEGIGSGVYYPKPLHTYPHVASFGYAQNDFPVAEAVAERVISLPVHPLVSEEDVQKIATVISGLAYGRG